MVERKCTYKDQIDRLDKILDDACGLWEYWGFEAWHFGTLSGVHRRVTFIKPALIGEVARYYAEDTIIWRCGAASERDDLWRSAVPVEDVMTQRFLFVMDGALKLKRSKPFMFGFKGMAEFYAYWPGGEYPKSIKDLAPLVDKAISLDDKKEVVAADN